MNSLGIGQHKPDSVRFRALMESGALIDEVADIVQTQVIVHKARASIRNRDTVPLYRQRAEGRPPDWAESIIVETGLADAPGSDSRYCIQDSHNLFDGIRYGAVEMDPQSEFKVQLMGVISIIAAVIIGLAMVWYVQSSNEARENRLATTAQEQAAEAEAEGMTVSEDGRVIHGAVSTLDEEGLGETPGEDQAEGVGGDRGGGSEDAVSP